MLPGLPMIYMFRLYVSFTVCSLRIYVEKEMVFFYLWFFKSITTFMDDKDDDRRSRIEVWVSDNEKGNYARYFSIQPAGCLWYFLNVFISKSFII